MHRFKMSKLKLFFITPLIINAKLFVTIFYSYIHDEFQQAQVQLPRSVTSQTSYSEIAGSSTGISCQLFILKMR